MIGGINIGKRDIMWSSYLVKKVTVPFKYLILDKMKQLITLLLLLLFLGCSRNSEIEIYQDSRDNIIDVKEQIKEVDTGDLLLSGNISPTIFGGYLAIKDPQSPENMIYFFDSKSYKYLGCTCRHGQGPGEVVSMGDIMWNEDRKEFYLPDYGSNKIYTYDINQVLADSLHLPSIKGNMNNKSFPGTIIYVNDTLSYVKVINPTSVSSFEEEVGRWNLQTGEIHTFPYKHRGLKVYRFNFTASVDDGIIVETNSRYDLVTILDLEGNLKCNIHGPNWDSDGDRKQHFGGVVIYKNYIISCYDGSSWSDASKFKLCHVFDLDGNYIKTLNIGLGFNYFTVDKTNHRLIFCFDDIDIDQIGYLDLDGILD